MTAEGGSKLEKFNEAFALFMTVVQGMKEKDMEEYEYKGFSLERIMMAFGEITDPHRKAAIMWITMRGISVKADKLKVSRKEGGPSPFTKAFFAQKALESKGAFFSQLANALGVLFANIWSSKMSIELRCHQEGIPRILFWTSSQYMSTSPSFRNFQKQRSLYLSSIFSDKKKPETMQTIRVALGYLEKSRTRESIAFFNMVHESA